MGPIGCLIDRTRTLNVDIGCPIDRTRHPSYGIVGRVAKPKTVGRMLVDARRRARLTITELARALRRSPRTVSRWEDGSTTPKPTDLAAVVDALAAYDARVSASLRESLGLPAPPPGAATVAERRKGLAWILYEAADEADLSPKRLRAALAIIARRASAAGFSIDEMRALLAE